MTKVNIVVGRFQPFTLGHQSILEALFKENGLPTVVCCISNKKFDSRHPFSDDLIKTELETCYKSEKFFKDVIFIKSANIVEIGEELQKRDCEAHLWGCGEDRKTPYEKMASNPKYTVDFPDDFKVFALSRDESSEGVDGISATKVRTAIKNNDKETFKKMMPKGSEKLFTSFKESIKENCSQPFKNLKDFIFEALKHQKLTCV
jgi:cytidyltransferase-like protein